MSRSVCVPELLAKGFERGRFLIVAVDIAQQAAQLFERNGVESTVFLQALLGTRPKPIEVPSGLGYADNRYVQVSAFHHCLQCWEDLFVGEIAGGAEENKRVRVRISHVCLSFTQPQIS